MCEEERKLKLMRKLCWMISNYEIDLPVSSSAWQEAWRIRSFCDRVHRHCRGSVQCRLVSTEECSSHHNSRIHGPQLKLRHYSLFLLKTRHDAIKLVLVFRKILQLVNFFRMHITRYVRKCNTRSKNATVNFYHFSRQLPMKITLFVHH